MLGSCYGTTGPASAPAPARSRWGADFPDVTIRDMVRVQAALLDALGVRRLRLVLGGSLGGMQVLEWALLFPERVDAIAPHRRLGAPLGLVHRPLRGAAAGHLRRPALARRPTTPRDDPPEAGLAAARAVAMCTYRSRDEPRGALLAAAAGRRPLRRRELAALTTAARSSTASTRTRYVTLTRAMDTHDVGRGRGGWREALASVRVPALVVSIDSDVLYPPVEQQELAAALPRGAARDARARRTATTRS